MSGITPIGFMPSPTSPAPIKNQVKRTQAPQVAANVLKAQHSLINRDVN